MSTSFHPTHPQIEESTSIPNQPRNIPALSESQPPIYQSNANQNIPKPPTSKPYYRITSYPIQNKTYRLLSISDQDSDQDSIPQPNPLPNPNLEDDFRQPLAFFPPGFNLFARWHPHPNRPRLNRRGVYRRNKSTLQSIFSSVKKIYKTLKSTRLSSLSQYIPFYPHPANLYSKYSTISQAILNNSIHLQSAVIKAMEYNIPLMQVIMNPDDKDEERVVVEKILKDFNIAHFVNQNFVLYGDWACYKVYRQVLSRRQALSVSSVQDTQNIQQKDQQVDSSGKIVFRKGQIVFSQIDLSYVEMIDRDQLQQKLQQIRNHYYRNKYLYRIQSSASSSTVSFSNDSYASSAGNSNGPAVPRKTVEEVEEQILKDYLEQRLEEQMAGEGMIVDQEESQDEEEEELLNGDESLNEEDDSNRVEYVDEDSSFSKSSIRQQHQKTQTHNSDMIESRHKTPKQQQPN